HRVLVTELLGQRRNDFFLVELFKPGGHFCIPQASTASPLERNTRTLRPSSSTLEATRSPLPEAGLNSITWEMWIGASRSITPPGWPACGFGLVWRLMMLTLDTTTFSPSTRTTSPFLPLSLPAVTTTWSPFLMRFMSLFLRSEHFRGERDDLHELLGTQLAGHRPEDAGTDRFLLVVEQHRGVAIEADQRPVRATDALAGAHDHGVVDLALLDLAARDRVLDGHLDDVADVGVPALGAAEHLDAHQFLRAGIVGGLQVGLHLDHGSALLIRLRARRSRRRASSWSWTWARSRPGERRRPRCTSCRRHARGAWSSGGCTCRTARA